MSTPPSWPLWSFRSSPSEHLFTFGPRRCSWIPLCISRPSPAFCCLPREPWVLLVGNGIRDQAPGAGGACGCWVPLLTGLLYRQSWAVAVCRAIPPSHGRLPVSRSRCPHPLLLVQQGICVYGRALLARGCLRTPAAGWAGLTSPQPAFLPLGPGHHTGLSPFLLS